MNSCFDCRGLWIYPAAKSEWCLFLDQAFRVLASFGLLQVHRQLKIPLPRPILFSTLAISTPGTTPTPSPQVQVDALINTSFTAVWPGYTNGSSNVTVVRPGSSNGSTNSNPFGYLETPYDISSRPAPYFLAVALQSFSTSWSSGHGSSLVYSPFGQMQIPSQAEPIHRHAYVSMLQG